MAANRNEYRRASYRWQAVGAVAIVVSLVGGLVYWHLETRRQDNETAHEDRKSAVAEADEAARTDERQKSDALRVTADKKLKQVQDELALWKSPKSQRALSYDGKWSALSDYQGWVVVGPPEKISKAFLKKNIGVEEGTTVVNHPGGVSSLLLADADGYLITAGFDKTVRFWDIKTGQQSGQFTVSEGVPVLVSSSSVPRTGPPVNIEKGELFVWINTIFDIGTHTSGWYASDGRRLPHYLAKPSRD